MTKAMIRPPHVTTSSGWVGSTTASRTPAPSVAITIAVPRASDPVSRSAATRTSVAPMIPSVVGVNASGSRPPVMCTIARTHANPTASMTARAVRSAAKARELDRRTSLSLGEDVMRHAVNPEVRAEQSRYVAYGHDEDAVMRATERDRGVGESLAESRRDDHECRAPGQVPALAEKHRLRRADRVWTETREDLEAAGERSRPAPECRPWPFVREVVDAVRDESDLPAGIRCETHELGRCGHNELGGLGIGLDPVLLIRGDVDEEDRVEARRRFIELGLKLPETRRCLPVDLLARIAAAVRANPAETQRVGDEPAARRRLRERTKRCERTIAHRERGRIRDDLRREGHGALRLRETKPVAAAQTERSDRVRASSRNAHRKTDHDALATSHRETAIDPAARRARCGVRGLHAFAEKEARLEPRQRQRFAVDDLDGRHGHLARDDPIRYEGHPHVHRGEREATGDLDDEPGDDRAHGKDNERRRAADRGDRDEEQGGLPGESTGSRVERVGLHRFSRPWRRRPPLGPACEPGPRQRSRSSYALASWHRH